MMESPIDVMGLYRAWNKADPGSRARLRRTATPDNLLDIPAFYALVSPFGWAEKQNRYSLLRMVFCLSSGVIKHTDDEGVTLGKALASRAKNIHPQRIMQLVRMDPPQDMVQLRRILIHADSVLLHWPSLARQLHWWGKYDRRALLENFVLSSSDKK